MKAYGLGNHKKLNEFVTAKIEDFKKSPKTFYTLFRLMFSEKENIMYEKSEGYRIVKKTYGEVYSSALKQAATLKEQLKDKPYDSVVALQMDNSLCWLESFWAILAAGFKPLLVNLRLDEETRKKTLADANAVAVIDSEIENAESELVAEDFGTELFVMSSGTSFNVKICAYCAEEFFYQIIDSYEIIKESKLMKKHYEGNLKQLTFLPFYHIFGLVAVYIWFAFFSRTLVQLNDMSPSTIQNTIKRHKVTHVFAVPLFWETVYDRAISEIKSRGEKTYSKFLKGVEISTKLHDIPLLGKMFAKLALKEVREGIFGDSICFMITGGSSIRPEAIKFFNAIGYHLADGYGMSEIGITSVELSNKAKLLNSCSVGKPMAMVEYKISDDGELLVRSKATAKYIIEGGERKEKEEWFNTHDLAEETNGHYRILGRKDDVIIGANGENINPNITEQVFMLPGVNDVCLTKTKSGENILPLLLISVDKYITNDEFRKLEENIRKTAAEQKVLSQLKIDFIKNSFIEGNDFKKNRAKIARDYDAGKFRLFRTENEKEDEEEDALMKEIHELFAFALEIPAERVSLDSDFFFDEGGTSLNYLALITRLQEEFCVNIAFDDETKLRTVRQMYEYIKEKRAEK